MPSDSDMQAFATSFAQLATNQLGQKVPNLMPKMLGFQVIDKAEDDSRAAGFFAFDLTGQLVYTPAFFLRGEIRGLEEIYVKDKDIFLPLDEEWIEFIESKKNIPLGETAKGSTKDLGITAPDFSQSSPFIYNSKMASLAAKMPDHFKGGLLMFQRIDERRNAKTAGLLEALRVSRPEIGYKFLSTIRSQPKIAEFVLQNYDQDSLVNAILDTSALKIATARILDEVKNDLEFFTKKTAGMSDAEKEALLKDGFAVRDTRTKTAEILKTEMQIYNNPTQAGHYKVLYKADGFEDAFVFNVFTVGSGRHKGFNLVYRKGDEYVNKALSRNILTDKAPSLSKQELADKIMKLGKSPSEVTKGQVVIFVDKYGNATLPHRITNVTSDDGKTYVKAHASCWDYIVEPTDKLPSDYDVQRRISMDRPLDGLSFARGYRGSFYGFDDKTDGTGYDFVKDNPRTDFSTCEDIVITDRPLDGFVNVGPKLLVPKDAARVIVLASSTEDSNSTPACTVSAKEFKEQEEKRAKRDTLGTANDVEAGLRKHASLDRVKVRYNGSDFFITSDKRSHSGLSKLAAMKTLSSSFMLRADEANEILKSACARGVDSFFIKTAITVGDISQPYFDSSIGVAANNPVSQMISDPNIPPTKETTPNRDFQAHDINSMNQAASTGQKDIFDSAALGALININDPGEEINRYVSDLIVSIDRLGRIMFMMYWHYDTFEERYEKQELVTLEDNLINVFKNLGELTLNLSKRSVVDNPAISGFQLA